MLLPRLVLVSVEREHDRLEEDVDFGHGDESTEGSDVTRFGLEEEEEVSVGLATKITHEEVSLEVGTKRNELELEPPPSLFELNKGRD